MVPPSSVDLEIALRHALVLEAGGFQHPARSGVLGQAGGLDPAQIHHREGVVDHGTDRLAHVALPGIAFAYPVAQRAGLRRAAADVVQGDRPQQHVGRAFEQEQRQRGAVVDAAPRPADPVDESAPGQVVRRPGRLPRLQELGAFLAQPHPGFEIRVRRRAEAHPLGSDLHLSPLQSDHAARRDLRSSRAGAPETGPYSAIAAGACSTSRVP